MVLSIQLICLGKHGLVSNFISGSIVESSLVRVVMQALLSDVSVPLPCGQLIFSHCSNQGLDLNAFT